MSHESLARLHSQLPEHATWLRGAGAGTRLSLVGERFVGDDLTGSYSSTRSSNAACSRTAASTP